MITHLITLDPHNVRHIAIINFTGMRENWGCQATSWELLKFINSAFASNALPQVRLVPLLPRCDLDLEIERTQLAAIHAAMRLVCGGNADHSDVATATRHTDHFDPASPASALAFLERLCLARYGFYAQAVQHSDWVFFQAEGTMAGTDFVRGARLLLLPFVAKHAWGKPVFALNQTLFICNDEFAGLAKAVLNPFDFVSVRESISFDLAHTLQIEPAYFIPDLAFLSTPAFDPRLPDLSGGPYFGLTGSAFFDPEVYAEIFRLADRIRLQTGLTPLLLASNVDHGLLVQAQAHWGKDTYRVVPPELSYSAVTYALKSCKFLLGGRYHMAIMAASVGVPSILLCGNSYKNVGLSAMLNSPFPVRMPSDDTAILHDVATLLTNYEPQCAALARAMLEIHAAIDAARIWLTQCLHGNHVDLHTTPPLAFVTPPGKRIEASAHMEPYRSATIAQADAFTYPSTTNTAERLGQKPSAEAVFPHLLGAFSAGDQAAGNAIVQLHNSYPEMLPACNDALRAAVDAVLYSVTTARQKSSLPIQPMPRSNQKTAGTTDLMPAPNNGLITYLSTTPLSDLKIRLIVGRRQVYSFGKIDDLEQHIQMLLHEFAGHSELLLYHAILIVLIRREIDLARNLENLNTLWTQESAFLCEMLDSRWLVSACDSLMDFSPSESERALAAVGSLFTNTLKLYETERHANGLYGIKTHYPPLQGRISLHDGLSCFMIGGGDMVFNMHRRVLAVCSGSSPAACIVRTLLQRARTHDTVYRRFKEVHHNTSTLW